MLLVRAIGVGILKCISAMCKICFYYYSPEDSGDGGDGVSTVNRVCVRVCVVRLYACACVAIALDGWKRKRNK